MSTFVLGLFIGMAAMALLVWKLMPQLMLTTHISRFGVDDTVAAIEKAAVAQKWKVPKIYDLQKTLHEAGHDEMTPVKIVSLCQPDHANQVLSADDHKKLTGIMPCRIGIYTSADGKVRLAKMNVKLMSKMFGGQVARVMAVVAEEEKMILKEILSA